ncbi:hypothetical protein VCUG_00259 [Vavraia culicis subsp. floridensis]|uniref:Brl1/Brr6 domain-containing protein n=1 Tax=Vavraia culicis (isolate floridensis) TaxID=948595 RepID=L2GY49_VAVCU|nr:uncharacterized protein VCUG_00259 [Vavraia culicis subsp. floridensis]ELA48218.1 hypothetical protein VCUG_00259 [Vavraia culicis subsp. floridensis]
MMNDRFKEEEFKLNLPREWYTKKNSIENNQLVKRSRPNCAPSSPTSVESGKGNNARVPFLVSAYALMSFNLLIIAILSFTIIKTFFVLRNDIRIRIDNEFADLLYLIEDSKYKYEVNRCGCIDIPAMRKDCMIWKNNMSKSRSDVEVMKIVMDCFGDMIDRFLERISWKFFIFSVCLTIVYLVIYKNNRR